MNRFLRWSAALAIAACVSPALARTAASPVEPAKLRFHPRVILEAVAQRMQVTLRPDVPMPAIYVESATPLRQFQDAIEVQWRARPSLVTNAYAIGRNEIYLSDDAAFYGRLGRTLDDSLAHELVHYIQAKYLNDDLSSDWCEGQAAEIQHWFRAAFVEHHVGIAGLDADELVPEQSLAGSDPHPGG
jgi:hypothetical protein